MTKEPKKKKARKKSPTARTLEHLRELGYVVGIVEQRIPKTFITRDLFGFIDLIYLTPVSIVAVQVTSGDNHAARRTKILAEPRARNWLRSGGLIEIWSWDLQGSRGDKKAWTLRKEEIVLEDFK